MERNKENQLLIGNFIVSVLIIFLWFQYGPFDKNTPFFVTTLVVVSALTSIYFLYQLQFKFDRLNYCSAFVFIPLLFVALYFLASIFFPNYIVKDAQDVGKELVEEVTPSAEPNLVNIIVAYSLFVTIVGAGETISAVGEYFSSNIWTRFRENLSQRKYLAAIVLFIIAIIIFLLFTVLSGLGP